VDNTRLDQVRQTAGTPPRLEQAAVDEFKASLRGELIGPQEAGYGAARQVWNAMIDRRPALIARCAGVADILAAVKFARRQGLPLAVRGGGHNVAGSAVCDDGLVVDLSTMKGLQVDPARRSARAEPGLTWGEFDHETQAFGLALTGGIHSTTGIAGFTLGGGFGWLARKHGLSCDNLLSADVVTADGEFCRASPTENAALFWGLRGGGGNFGIVTSFEFQLHPLGPVLGGMLLYPLEQAPSVLKFYREYAAQAPDELFTIVALRTAPSTAAVPASLHGAPVVAIMLCYCGDIAEGESLLKPLRSFGPPAGDLIRVMPYTELQSLFDAANPPGLQNYWKAEYIQGYDDGAIHALCQHVAQKTSPMSKVLIAQLLGAISRVGQEGGAYSHRDAPFLVNINATWTEPHDGERHIDWARGLWADLQPFSHGGTYMSFLSNEGEERVRAAYGPQTYERLVALKTQYDPDNFFHFNQNIAPSG
jgi:FAD/FMN-containing dehydrogenase